MLAEAVLSASVFIPPTLRPHNNKLTPSSLALQVLHTLSHLSFVFFFLKFGGVVTTNNVQGFEHLKKTFYLALDILAHGDGDGSKKAEPYVQQACFALNSQRMETG